MLQAAATEIAGMLPYNSTIRASIQAKTVATLYNSLQHPPASYLGDQFQYRTADGSHHVSATNGTHRNPVLTLRLQNFLYPDFGKAGQPYAKTVRSAKKLHGSKPDPSVLFDRESSTEWSLDNRLMLEPCSTTSAGQV